MCGILAVAGRNLLSDYNSIRDMMKHRGPDAAGAYVDDEVYLGHRRLAIVDLSSRGNQPFHNHTRDIHLVANAEVYNAPALRRQLQGMGHTFISNSDNEVILHAYAQWGYACLERLLGMFAFIIWDKRTKTIFAARDQAGIKPLYVYSDQQTIALASECTPLAALSPKAKINRLGLAYYLTLGYAPAPLSIWENITKLEAGQCLTWSQSSGVKYRQYWAPPTALDNDSRVDEWDELLGQVVEDQMQADVPISAFLSAGLDSTSLCHALARRGNRIQTLSMGFADQGYDESATAAKTAAYLGLPFKRIEIGLHDVDELLDIAVRVYDEPSAYGSFVNTVLLCQEAAKYGKVIFSGDGGDEVLGGYNWYSSISTFAKQSNAYATPKKRFWYILRNRYKLVDDIDAGFADFSNRSPLHKQASMIFPRFLPEEASWLVFGNTTEFNEETMLAPLNKWYESGLPAKRAAQRVDLMTFCADVCLPKVDRASMSYSLEVRPPFLDKRIIEWGLSRPMTKAFEKKPKQIMRTFLQNNVPEEILKRPKQGFSLRCLAEYDFNAVVSRITKSHLAASNLLAPGWENRLTKSCTYRTGRIWCMYFLAKWFDAQIENGLISCP